MDSYQPTEDCGVIRRAAIYLKGRIEQTMRAMVMYDPGQIVNVPLDSMRRDIKRECSFLPEAVRLMNAFHTDRIKYERDATYKMLQQELNNLEAAMADLTDVPPIKKRVRHYRTKQGYEAAQAEISALAAKILAPMTPGEQWRLIQSRMRRKCARERAAAS